MKWLAMAGSCAAGLAAAAPLAAEPQVSTAIRAGVAGESQLSASWHHTNFYGAFRGDVLIGRDGGSEFGFGPFLELGTSGFDDLRIATGASVLVPIHVDLPLVVSAGAYVKSAEPSWAVGINGEIFWGLRSYNYHSFYAWSAGVFAGLQYDLTSVSEHTFLLGVQVDNALLALPLVILINWFRASPD